MQQYKNLSSSSPEANGLEIQSKRKEILRRRSAGIQVASLEDLISKLYAEFEKDKVDVDYICDVMTAYKSVPSEWKKYSKFDRYRYTRNLVDSGNGKFNLMILCWGEGHGSAIHDHANAHCFMKILDGKITCFLDICMPNDKGICNKERGKPLVKKYSYCRNKRRVSHYTPSYKDTHPSTESSHSAVRKFLNQEDSTNSLPSVLFGTLSEVRFASPSDTIQTTDSSNMKEIGRTELKLNEVCYINDSLGLHRVENPSHVNPAVSLHLYCPPFDSCSVFNQQTGQRTTCKVTFWSKYGDVKDRAVQEREPEDN